MNSKRIIVGLILVFIVCASFNGLFFANLSIFHLDKTTDFSEMDKSILSCTIFTVSIGNTTYFGNNEDYKYFGTYMWFIPAYSDRYGVVCFGFKYNQQPGLDGYPQGGMNTQGLSCDGNGLPEVPLNPHPERSPILGPFMQIVLQECATVNETIEWCQNHNFGSSFSGQIHFADASGDAVVISGGQDGELAYTRKNDSNYLVSTNFNLANYDNGWYPCSRYDTAVEMLDDITNETDITIEACRDVLNAVHQTGTYGTKYSNVFDLKTCEIYVYYNHNFAKYVKLNLTEELTKGRHEYGISDLFNITLSSSLTTLPTSPSLTTTKIINSTVNTNFLSIKIVFIVLLVPVITTFIWKRRKSRYNVT